MPRKYCQIIVTKKLVEQDSDSVRILACVAGPQFYGGPDLQRAGFWRARGRIEGQQESPPFMTTRPSHNIINGF